MARFGMLSAAPLPLTLACLISASTTRIAAFSFVRGGLAPTFGTRRAAVSAGRPAFAPALAPRAREFHATVAMQEDKVNTREFESPVFFLLSPRVSQHAVTALALRTRDPGESVAISRIAGAEGPGALPCSRSPGWLLG